ncbi:MAG: quinolinate synthase NadA [Candidatus Bathyarchaeota archaeon]|nr:quinolinate synthase NadA [Candidatus Bathyarchaeota archaeon]MDD4325717.1 quinolinate synthase NadA [Candidatus Bathyarchaeota archaeon]MDI9577754.1 quinolinate synthase NadA [Thermoproteota archaeon]MDT8782925.1 quinolinate synthase NadA [Candidatus Bathyarchaeota archaeon]NLD66060.1 quinolinate synthase NadA [Thermoproteota archaeon]
MDLTQKILNLKKEKKAVILAHNYQRPEIQDIADYVGDSIELSRKAAEVKDAEIIVFCAVDFMAQSAAIMNPHKKVLLPCSGARCPMAQMLTVDEVKRAKKQHPNVPVVLYVNTLAECKAESDISCTSANAVEVVNSLNADTVLMGPDSNLAAYVAKKTGKKVIPIPQRGFCPTHILFQPEDVLALKMQHPNAVVMAHPECTVEMQQVSDFIGSTSKMCRYAKESKAKEFIVGTEEGILHRLQKENPDKKFYVAYDRAVCPNMKLTTLEKVYNALKEEKNVVEVPEAVAKKAKSSLERMFKVKS